MSKLAHGLYIGLFTIIVILTLFFLIYNGMEYYQLPVEERYFNEDHQSLKPSGILGHGLGIIGSLLMILGVSSYMARKRWRSLSKLGLLKHWLEFHIFVCTLGPLMVLFHTSFKFGGIVAISFWSMVAVFASGIIGRFIYIRIPRTIEGRQLSLNEVRAMEASKLGDRKAVSLDKRIKRLETMHRLFKYWHVAHLPFALVMLVIMLVHVVVTVVFGYKWIF